MIITDHKRAWVVFGNLLEALREKRPPFDKVQTLIYPVPKNVVPGSREHAIFLFCSCYYMRGKINSNTALDLLVALHESDRHLFRPFSFASLKGEDIGIRGAEIAEILERSGLGFNAKEIGLHWVLNFRKLSMFWGGDLLRIFTAANGDYDKLCQMFMGAGKKGPDDPRGFYGFREKMVSMLSYFYIQAGMVEHFDHPVPVDFHILRILVSTEILTISEMIPGTRMSVEKLSRSARALTLEYCRETGVETKELSDALWHMSRKFCVEHPGNRSSVGKYKGRKTPIIVPDVAWSVNDQKKFRRTCGRCPIQGRCEWNIPSANYFIQGVIFVRRRWEPSPQKDLFS